MREDRGKRVPSRILEDVAHPLWQEADQWWSANERQEEGGEGQKRGITKGPRQNFGGDTDGFLSWLLWFFILIIDYRGGSTSVYMYIMSEFLKLHTLNMQFIASSINVFWITSLKKIPETGNGLAGFSACRSH